VCLCHNNESKACEERIREHKQARRRRGGENFIKTSSLLFYSLARCDNNEMMIMKLGRIGRKRERERDTVKKHCVSIRSEILAEVDRLRVRLDQFRFSDVIRRENSHFSRVARDFAR
jgi:hypothetical protein